jgi:hypothetical protein
MGAMVVEEEAPVHIQAVPGTKLNSNLEPQDC